MRVEQAKATVDSEDVLSGALMSLLLVAGVLLSSGAPTKRATSFTEVGRPEAAEPASTTPDSISPDEATAETPSPGLQLD